VAGDTVKESVRPELISPLVLKLTHEGNEENGGLFEVGAGWFAKLCWGKTMGGRLDYTQNITVDDVESIWDQVIDFSKSEHPHSQASASKTPFAPIMKG
jgi:3-hydroxyacyl-CoA dehydrogenase/3a,7a,12a-trihydroxy-5b-cholest-24-enoyl-CoA hydratase